MQDEACLFVYLFIFVPRPMDSVRVGELHVLLLIHQRANQNAVVVVIIIFIIIIIIIIVVIFIIF